MTKYTRQIALKHAIVGGQEWDFRPYSTGELFGCNDATTLETDPPELPPWVP